MASFDDDDFDSDTSDDDYVPVEGEILSEEENSGEDEEKIFGEENEENEKKGKKRKNKSTTQVAPKLRKGGIRLDGEKDEDKQEEFNHELAEAIVEEQKEKKQVDEKKKADSLWADFMKDAAPSKAKPKSGTGLGSLSTVTQKNVPSTAAIDVKPSPVPKPLVKKVTITQEFDFAGETVKVTKEVDANSKEAAAAVKVGEPESSSSATKLGGTAAKRPGGGLGSLLGKIGKKPKIGTLEKSKLDWDSFKSKEGISEELKIHNRGKSGYLERMDFLSRTDEKQFELERNIRLGSSSKR